MEQETERIDENMPLLALDQLAGIEAMRIDAGPPFFFFFFLWMVMIGVFGLVCCSPCCWVFL